MFEDFVFLNVTLLKIKRVEQLQLLVKKKMCFLKVMWKTIQIQRGRVCIVPLLPELCSVSIQGLERWLIIE